MAGEFMSDNKHEEISYEIYPMKSLSMYLGFIAALLGIGTSIYLLDSLWRIISIFSIIILLLVFFLLKISFRLRTVVKKYNNIVNEVNHANDNRETLAGIVEQKNIEINNLKRDYHTTFAIINFFIAMVYSESELPERKIVEDSLKLENSEDNKYEKQKVKSS